MPTKQWLEANKEAVREQRRAYYQANKERIKKKQMEYHYANKEVCNAKSREYYQKNKEHIKKQTTGYYFVNKEARKEINELRHQKYRKENKEVIKQSNAKWREKNKDYDKVKGKLWRQANPAKCLAYVRNRQAAKMQRTPKWLTSKDFEVIELMYAEAKNREVETGIKHHVDHIIPLRGKNVSGLHVPANLQIISATDNVRKGNRYQVDA